MKLQKCLVSYGTQEQLQSPSAEMSAAPQFDDTKADRYPWNLEASDAAIGQPSKEKTPVPWTQDARGEYSLSKYVKVGGSKKISLQESHNH